MPSAWINHVKAFQKANGCSYKEALKQASSTYQKGSGAMGLSKADMGVPSSKQQGSGLRNTTNPGMHTTGGNLQKATKAQLIRLIGALGDKGISKLSGMGAVGNMLKQTAANTTAQLITSGGDRASSEMETRGTSVNRLNKANRWEQFANSTLRDAIDTSGKAGRVYYDTTSPMSQMGFGLKKHKRLSGRALLAAGY